ncbi:MFS transporter [Paracraurococcus lichenis]|uniref:MFS transporter n=1 Tax=Paracraurococcus lichenis TaxID=3064888 RepID=A0ABT9E451_9PROT|nr:MFS transporter [Paracraurococcus sp. LOR1-02]MDO9710918.1 MFS transporter [Paracraurococcus sp. LOR1-02]
MRRLSGPELPILALTLGHVFSNAVRTLPAIAADVLSRDLGLTPEGLAALTGAFPATFALAMVPVGIGLDRWGVRRTALVLLGIGMAGSALAALAPGPGTMLLAQCVLGMGCAGALMCPMTYAARAMDGHRFALWSGIIQAFGNCGMLLSASPLALLVERQGWRAGFWASGALAALAFVAVAATVQRTPPAQAGRRSLWQDTRDILAIAVSPRLRAPMTIGFASFAVVLGVRGLWGGPWLMQAKGLTRVEAGNVLLLVAVALVAGPAIAGVVQRLVGRPVALLAGSHLTVAALVLLLPAGGPGGWLSRALGQEVLPASFDAAVMVAIGLVISFQILVFAQVRAAVPPEQTGRALSANNIAFFGGAAVLQAVSGFAAAWGGTGAALSTFAVALVVCSLAYLWLRRPGRPSLP